LETNENNYDSVADLHNADEDHEPLQEPHPEPGGDVSEKYEDDSS